MYYHRWLLDTNHILNCTCTGKDDEIAEEIFGQDVGKSRGRKLRETQTPVPRLALQDVPAKLKPLHEQVKLFVDALCENIMLFSHAMSEKSGVRTSQSLPNRFKNSLLNFVKEVVLFHKIMVMKLN